MYDNTGNYFIPFHLTQYWDEYYKYNMTKSSDWYVDLLNFNSNLFNIKNIDIDSEILILGCGNSETIDYFISKKFPHVTLVDFSQVAIEYLKNKYQSLEECKEWDFVCIDVCKLTHFDLIPDDFYDVVIDKGCLDCILSDPKNAQEKFSAAIKEIYKTMKKDGILYYLSTAKPEKRISFLTNTNHNAKVEIEEISKIMFFYYRYE